MPQYLAPGVYVEEVASAIKPIAGVGTSTAGFIGIVADNVTMPPQPGKFKLKAKAKPGDPDELELDPKTKEPIPIPYSVAKASEPQPINSWGEFTQKFGEVQARQPIPGACGLWVFQQRRHPMLGQSRHENRPGC